METNIPEDFAPDLAWTSDDLAGTLKCSRGMVDLMASDGRIGPRPIKLGALVRWSAAEIRRWFEAGCPPRELWQAIKGCDQCVADGEVCKACRQFAALEAAKEETEPSPPDYGEGERDYWIFLNSQNEPTWTRGQVSFDFPGASGQQDAHATLLFSTEELLLAWMEQMGSSGTPQCLDQQAMLALVKTEDFKDRGILLDGQFSGRLNCIPS